MRKHPALKQARVYLIAVIVSLLATQAIAQTGGFRGVIRDGKTGDPLIGANVLLIGTIIGTTTDLDGKYEIQNVPPGSYDVRIFYVGFGAEIMSGIVVETGKSTKLNAKLSPLTDLNPDTFAIEDLQVTAERVLSTSTAMLTERMKSATIGDAISAEQIAKSPDATSGDALKRVTGLSVVDDKYVFVRGVTDRYNATTLNGISVASTDTEVDRKSFAFDLIPASLLSNTVVVKTATPDLPGDFSGGLVQVNTLDFPSERVARLSAAFSSNDLTTGKPQLSAQGGSRDWLGKDDGSRTQQETRDAHTGTKLAQKLTNNWGLLDIEAPFNGSYSLSYGDKYGLGGTRELGAIAALTYKQSYRTSQFTEATEPGGVESTRISGERYRFNVLWGGLINLNYRASENHKFGFKNNYIRTAKQDVSVATGKPASADSLKKQTAEWNERTLYLGQLSGSHMLPFFGENDLDLNWRTFYSDTKAKEPDRKNLDYHPHAWIDTIWILAENHRTWSDLTEESAGADLDFNFELGKTKLKAGALYSVRKRNFSVDAWYTDRSILDSQYSILSILPPNQIFANENYGTDEDGNNKFRFIPWTDLTGEYTGKHDLFSYFAMADAPFKLLWQRLRLTGGARIEHSDQKVYTALLESETSDDPFSSSRIDEVDVLPSVNLTWLLHDLANLRLAYYESVNRPEFREMSNVKYFDFQRLRNVQGNPNLKRAEITSYDLRLEFFPDVDEVLAVSFFYKKLHNAIEEELLANPDRFVQTWFNSEKGNNYGYELEARKSLGFLGSYFRNFMLGANYTKVNSSVEYEDPPNSGIIMERPLQGQAPWMVNASFTFVEPTLGTTFSVLYNRFGRRLDGVGDSREEDVYEEGRDIIDLAITQQFVGNSTFKFAIRNLAGKDEIFTWGTSRRVQEQLTVGTTYGLSFSYTF